MTIAEAVRWEQLHQDGLESQYQALLHEAEMKARAAGIDEWGLWPFQYRDVVRASLKQNVLLAYQMGLGKTAVSLALATLYGSRHTLIVAPKRLFGEWVSEIRRLGLLRDFQIVETAEDAANLKRYNLASLTDLWRIPKDSPERKKRGQANYRERKRGDTVKKIMGIKYSLAWHLRKLFGTVIVDEAYTMKDMETNQSRAVMALQAKHKVLLTGTPVRGYPNNILSLLNWCFGNGSDVWPEYSFFVEGAVQRFLNRFGTYVYYDDHHSRTASAGKKKLLPKIADPEGFQNMLAPKMIRRLNTEPEVQESVQIPVPELHYEAIEMDQRHRRAYEKVLADFQAWYEEAEAQAREEGRDVRRNEILVKLTALIGCASFPQLMDREWQKSGEPTAKQKRALELVDQYVAEGRKVIVLSRSVEGARWIRDRIEGRGYGPLYVDGSVSLNWDRKAWSSKRLQRLALFRESEQHRVLVGTTPCLAEGLNLPEASVVVFMDYDWVPSVMAQAFSRVLRPQQQWDVHVYFLTCKGTIEEYMELLCDCKQRSIAEGLDYEEYDFQLENLPDIKAYAQALVTSQDILSRYQRARRLASKGDEDDREQRWP
jgi:SNF2 family DNA or RNA helicase